MSIFLIVCSGIVGTLLMTAFSYLVSVVFEEQFREPALLNKLLFRANVLRNSRPNHLYGWAIHFTVGILFNVVYYALLEGQEQLHSLFIFVLFGTLSGILACIVWRITFQLHPAPPKINYKGFYLQLFLAHIVFGMGSWLPLK